MRRRTADTSRCLLALSGEGNSKSLAARFFISFSNISISRRMGTHGVVPRFSRVTCSTRSLQFTVPHVIGSASPILKPLKARKQTKSAMASSFLSRNQTSILPKPSGVGATSRQCLTSDACTYRPRFTKGFDLSTFRRIAKLNTLLRTVNSKSTLRFPPLVLTVFGCPPRVL